VLTPALENPPLCHLWGDARGNPHHELPILFFGSIVPMFFGSASVANRQNPGIN